ncbi:hypothetical protein BJV74DRAFT_794392 [Russula compacta]|nr:hypothetical protein BJV74DRAFT_794392 [Russula compacta]
MALSRGRPWEWHRLVHLFCTNGTPVRNTLHCWPALPIVMRYGVSAGPDPLAAEDEDEIVVALQQSSRIWMIQLLVTTPLLEKMVTITWEPLSTLELLELTTQTGTGLILDNQSQFFGGEAPHLRTLRVAGIAFPALPQLLLSAKNLVSLQLEAVPSTGYIPPEALVDGLEYLECLLACIDAPTKYIYITFFNDLDFEIPQLQQFIGRAETQRFPEQAMVHYSGSDISITFAQRESPHRLGLRISCRLFDWQMASISEICTQLGPSVMLSSVRQLDIYASPPFPYGHDDMDPSPFLQFLRAFGDVERLRVAKEIGAYVAHVLVGGDMLLPKLEDLFIEENDELESVQRTLAPFFTERRRSNHPVVLHRWEPSNDVDPSTHHRRAKPTRAPIPSIQKNDPALVLEEDVREMCQQFSSRPFGVQSLYQRARLLFLSFMRGRRVKELDESIAIAQDLLEMRPRQIRRVKLLRMLAFCYALGGHVPGHRGISVSRFEDAFQDESATTSERLSIAWWWATFARTWDHPSTSLAYQNTLSALQAALTGTFTVQRRHGSVARLGLKIHIPFEYASYRIERDQLELAVEAIEQGKTLIWSEIYGIRTFAGRLRTVNLDLADRLATVSQDLVAVNASILARRAGGTRLDEEEDHEHTDAFSSMFKEQRRLLRECQEVIAAIKTLPGFENFMEAVPYRTLQEAASRGPIIIINHCPWRCDILILSFNSPPSLIPMTEGFYERAGTWASTLFDARKRYAVESSQFQEELLSLLKEMHEQVGQPVINKLRELGIPEQSRIWWYPTSVFCSLPLHAMGPVPSTDSRERYFSDIYICSYTPTLGALITARAAASAVRGAAAAHRVSAERGRHEGDQEHRRARDQTRLWNATREAVIGGLQKHSLVHFACGGALLRQEGKPFDAALELDGEDEDGDRLTLLDLVRSRIPTAELAVLAVGRTAELHYGFGSVVGAMWDLGNDGGEDFALGFYKEMLSPRGGGGGGGGGGETTEEGNAPPLTERSAGALQYMVRKLRERRVPLQRWANWVHYASNIRIFVRGESCICGVGHYTRCCQLQLHAMQGLGRAHIIYPPDSRIPVLMRFSFLSEVESRRKGG